MPLAQHGHRPAHLRRRASCPQLKRDPLGSRAASDSDQTTEGTVGLFSRKKTPLPDSLPAGTWGIVQGSNQGNLLLARGA